MTTNFEIEHPKDLRKSFCKTSFSLSLASLCILNCLTTMILFTRPCTAWYTILPHYMIVIFASFPCPLSSLHLASLFLLSIFFLSLTHYRNLLPKVEGMSRQRFFNPSATLMWMLFGRDNLEGHFPVHPFCWTC